MNELKTTRQWNKDANVQMISSREVAEMLEIKEHGKMLRKIDSLNEILTKTKLAWSDYWIESEYLACNGEKRREYLVTKKGCELIAHKTTGEKGVLFTVRYMERFEELQKAVIDSYMISDPIERAKRWIEEQQERLLLAEKVEEQRPKVEYHDKVLNSDKLITTTDVAKDLGMSARKLHTALHEKGIIYRQGTNWKLYAKYEDRVPTYCDYVINEYSQQLKWTEKGRKWIIDVLA